MAANAAFGESAPTSGPPAHIQFVPHPNVHRLAKHPTLPVLYLGLTLAPESKNLATFRLDAEGNMLTNSMQTFPNYFTDDGNNPTNLYSILRPMVLPDRKVLLLVSSPYNYSQYATNTNAQHIAAVGLDDEGQPAKLITAFRTTHMEHSITHAVLDMAARRLFLSYYPSYWGWLSIGDDGVPSREFHMLTMPYSFWDFVFVSRWQRFIGVISSAYLCNVRLTTDASALSFIQMCVGETSSYGGLDVSASLGKAYVLNGPDYKTVAIYALDSEGRLVGVPRSFPAGPSLILRVDPKARRLYSFSHDGVIRIHPLDPAGHPSGQPQVFQASCGTIRDVVLDETSGRLYVACTEPPK